jgi:hypothetical protein
VHRPRKTGPCLAALRLAIFSLLLHFAVPAFHHGPMTPFLGASGAIAGAAEHSRGTDHGGGHLPAGAKQEFPADDNTAAESCCLSSLAATALPGPTGFFLHEPFFSVSATPVPRPSRARAGVEGLVYQARAPPVLG